MSKYSGFAAFLATINVKSGTNKLGQKKKQAYISLTLPQLGRVSAQPLLSRYGKAKKT